MWQAKPEGTFFSRLPAGVQSRQKRMPGDSTLMADLIIRCGAIRPLGGIRLQNAARRVH
jgi:hypothetical protein